MDMRGLAHFIRDIRAATGNKTREERRVDEELAKIRAKFVDTHHMSTYDRKKYVCKLMFIAMLGYPIEFGHIEGIKLMADESPAAKLIGYISTTVLVNEYSELLTLTTHTVYRDLLSGVDFNQGLALTAIANAGGKDFAEVMHDGVQNIVLDGSVGMHIRQKAILALLRVYRKYPEVVDLPSVVPKVLELMDSAPSGVCMCAITFIAACVESSGKSTSLYDEIPSKLIRVLERIIVDKDTEPGYVYYGVPAPWLQSKALRLLQSLPPPADRGLRTRIEAVLRKVLKATEKVLKDAQAQQRQRGTQNRVNAMNAVLVEVVSLCITWDLGSNFTVDCANLISGFISEKREANLRYVGLTLLARLSMSQSPAFHFASYCRQLQPQIIVSLHDRDGSLRRRALHVLEEMCNSSNARDILQELQSYVPVVMDVDFRRCLVLSIARLADRYCVDDTPWHVDVLLGLIAQAGECCPSEIAHRVVRLIVNTPAVQKRAANVAFRTLASGVDGHPTLLQTVAFILGEFGYQIALSAESTPIRQLLLLQRHLAFTSVSTQGIILAAFMKWYPMYDDADVRTQIEDTLSSFADSTHPELQQRANEYRALIHHGSLPLLEKVLGAMPPFPREAESAYSSHPTTRLSASHRSKSSQNPNVSSEGVPAPQLLLNRPEDGLVSLSQLDALWSSPDSGDAHAVLQLYTQRRAWFKGMLMSNVEGVLFEDDHLHITCRQVNCGADSRLTLRVTNISSEAIVGMTLQVQEVEGGLRVQLRPASALVDPLPAQASATVEIATRCGQPFAHPPSVGVSYRDATGEFHMEVLSLPVAVTRFIVPYVAGSGESLLETVKRLQNSLPPPLSIMVDHKGRLNLQLVENLLSRAFLCGVVRGQAAGSVVVVGALASQLGAGPVLHDPVVLELRVGESEVHADVCASSPALQTAILAVVELLLEA